jgi:hypothetical protein
MGGPEGPRPSGRVQGQSPCRGVAGQSPAVGVGRDRGPAAGGGCPLLSNIMEEQ